MSAVKKKLITSNSYLKYVNSQILQVNFNESSKVSQMLRTVLMEKGNVLISVPFSTFS